MDGVGVGMTVGRGVAVGASGAIGATAGVGVLVGVAGGAGDAVGRWAIAGPDASGTGSATLLSGVRPGAGVGVGGEGDAHARRSKTRTNVVVDLVMGLVSLWVDIYSLRSLCDCRLRRPLISIVQFDDLADECQGKSSVDYNAASHGGRVH